MMKSYKSIKSFVKFVFLGQISGLELGRQQDHLLWYGRCRLRVERLLGQERGRERPQVL